MKTTKPIVTIFWHLYGKRILNCKIYDLNQPGPHGQGQILKKYSSLPPHVGKKCIVVGYQNCEVSGPKMGPLWQYSKSVFNVLYSDTCIYIWEKVNA